MQRLLILMVNLSRMNHFTHNYLFMKNSVFLNRFLYVKFLTLVGLLLQFSLYPADAQAQFLESPPSVSSSHQLNSNYSDVSFGQEAFLPSQTFSPASSFQQISLKQGESFDPVLYGPGGNPIGGLPLEKDVQFLFYAVLGYCVYKTIERYKISKL